MEVSLATVDRGTGQRLGFVPAGAGSQVEQGDGVGVIVGGALALFEQLADLRQGEKGQLYLIRLDLPDIGERILSYPGTAPDQRLARPTIRAG